MGVRLAVLQGVVIMERRKPIEYQKAIRFLRRAKVKYLMRRTKGSSALNVTNFSSIFSRKSFRIFVNLDDSFLPLENSFRFFLILFILYKARIWKNSKEFSRGKKEFARFYSSLRSLE